MKKSWILSVFCLVVASVFPVIAEAEHKLDSIYNDGSMTSFEEVETYAQTIPEEMPANPGPVAAAAQQSLIKPTGIIGEDNRQYVEDTTITPYRQVAFIQIGTSSQGTGNLIAPDTILTAAHCVYNDGKFFSVSVMPGRSGFYEKPFGTHTPESIMVPREWVETKNPDYDFAVIKLSEPIGNQLGWFGLSQELKPSMPVTLSGYHIDKYSYQTTETGTVLDYSDSRVFYDMDAMGGSSGSGIYNDKNQIVAVGTQGSVHYNTGPRVNKDRYSLIHYWAFSNKKSVRQLKLVNTPESIKIKETIQLEYQILPENAEDLELIWKSSDEAVADVSDNGVLTGRKSGKATVSVATTDGKLSDSFEINVLNEPYDDHGNTEATATALENGKEVSFSVDYKGDLDYFTFTVPEDGYYVTSVTVDQEMERLIPNFSMNNLSGDGYDETTNTTYKVNYYTKGQRVSGFPRGSYKPHFNASASLAEGTTGKVKIEKTTSNVELSTKMNKVNMNVGESVHFEMENSFPKELPYNKIRYSPTKSDVVSIDEQGNIKALKPGKTSVFALHFSGYSNFANRISIEVTVRDDHGNTGDTASILKNGEAVSFSIDYKDDVDFFTFTAPEAGYYVTSVTLDQELEQMMPFFSTNILGESKFDSTVNTTYYVKYLDKDQTFTGCPQGAYKPNFKASGSLAEGVTGKVKVEKATSNVKLSANIEKTEMSVGEELKLEMTNSFPKELPYNPLRYASTKPDIVSVDEQGNMKALKPGKATISVFHFSRYLYTDFANQVHVEINVQDSGA